MEHGCASGGPCGCGSQAAEPTLPVMQAPQGAPRDAGVVACVNGVALHAAGQRPPERELRQWACTELLRQAAQQAGLLPAQDAPALDGAISEAAAQAIDLLLEQTLQVPEPAQDACRRHYEAHAARFSAGGRVQLRHVLFAVTPGVDVRALAQRAERLLLELRCADDGGVQFAAAARQWSNCPSGQDGGDLGWLRREDCAPEFAREVFASQEVGVLPRLVRSRFGLHVVEVCGREAGIAPEWSQVQPAVAQALRQQTWIQALRQYVQLRAGEAEIVGVELEAADTPLVQ